MRYAITTLVAACSLLAGCTITPERVGSMPDSQLCAVFGNLVRDQPGEQATEVLRAEVGRRNLLDHERDMPLIQSKKIGVGMSECALYASWGWPTKQNRSVSRGGVRIQHVYGTHFYGRYITSRPTYVYTEGGKVTGWQD